MIDKEKQIKRISQRIMELHRLKQKCRRTQSYVAKLAYMELGIEHCKQCQEWTDEQELLRVRRKALSINIKLWKMKK